MSAWGGGLPTTATTDSFAEPLVRKAVQIIGATAHFCRRKRLAALGLSVAIFFFCIALFADAIAPYAYEDSVGGRLESPNSSHWFGTDRLGRDQLSRVIYGARISMFVGMGSMFIGVMLATAIGLTAMLHRYVDLIAQRCVDVVMSFPWLVILLSVVAVWGTSITTIIVILGILQGINGSRIMRGAVLSVQHLDYIQAASLIGCSAPRVMMRHVLPNVAPTLMVLSTINVGFAILAEAALSYLGLGVPPPQPSWGRMLSSDLAYMVVSPWLALWPGLALTLTVFAFNVLGDGLRDALDPRMRGSE